MKEIEKQLRTEKRLYSGIKTIVAQFNEELYFGHIETLKTEVKPTFQLRILNFSVKS